MDQQFCFTPWDEDDPISRGQVYHLSPGLERQLTPELLADRHVLVPFCGSCPELGYFAEHAAQVTGIDVSAEVIAQRNDEQQLRLIREGTVWQRDRLTILCMDFFTITPDEAGQIDVIYDRGALMGLSPDMRERFVQKIHGLCPVGGVQYLHTLEFAPDTGQPPCSLSPDQVRCYYGLTHDIEHLQDGLLSDHPLIAARRLEYLRAHLFRLTRSF